MIIPFQQLRPATLQAIIEDYVTRQGAVHGHQDVPLDTMVRQVLRQLNAGAVVVVYSDTDATCGIYPAKIAAKISDSDRFAPNRQYADDHDAAESRPPQIMDYPD